MPTPEAIAAAKELHSENWHGMTYDQMIAVTAAAIDRHIEARVDALVSVCRENVISARIIQAANRGRSYDIDRDAKFILERTEKVLPPR